jgi:hypothetical protein
MNHPHELNVRNCRIPIVSSRIRRQVMAETLDQQWRQIRRDATIERDTPKLAKLIADWRNANR